MEPDELKQAWRTLGIQLERQNAINLSVLRDRKLDKARRHLRPLLWGQIVQILFGIGLSLLGASSWSRNLDAAPLLIAGIVVYVYGVVVIITAGITLDMISKIDPAAPVLTIQKHLLKLGRVHLVNGMIVGLPWWLMHVPLVMALGGLSGIDPYADAPAWFWSSVVIGIAGLIGTWIFHRWSRSPKRAGLGRRLDESAMGGSIRRSRLLVEEIARFEDD